MKQTAFHDSAQQQMRPGVITRDGFLGTDRRKLIDILIEDDAEVKRLGYTHTDIADRMRELRDAGAHGLGLDIAVEPHYRVRVEGVRGKLPCPFGDRGLFPKTNTTIQNTAVGDDGLTFTDLHIHMIEAHGFYEGRGAGMRLDPERLIRLIEPRRGGE